jgi:hypothetical protein
VGLRQNHHGAPTVSHPALERVKQSGKTLLAAVLLLWWCFTTPHTEAVILANDLEQAQSRVFKTAVDLFKANPDGLLRPLPTASEHHDLEGGGARH